MSDNSDNSANANNDGYIWRRVSAERNIPVDENDPAAVARLIVNRSPREGPIFSVLSRHGQEPSPAWREAVRDHIRAMRPHQQVVVYTRNEFHTISGMPPPSR